MTILDIEPGKPKMHLQENLVDCADCGGLANQFSFKQHQYERHERFCHTNCKLEGNIINWKIP